MGKSVWKDIQEKNAQTVQDKLASTVMLQEINTLELENDEGARFRIQLLPLHSPDAAVCILCREVPCELSKLTCRERECLELLAQGLSTRTIAEQLDVGVSTVHTHVRRARGKLELPTAASLISFAARFCYPSKQIQHQHSANL